MNIDVEWHEIKVLESNDWQKFRPKFLLVDILNFDIDTILKNPGHLYLRDIGCKFTCKTPRTSFFVDTMDVL